MALTLKQKAKLVFYGAEAIWIAGSTLHMQWERNSYFTEARSLADSIGKPLINIGCGDYNPNLFPRALAESDLNIDVVPQDVPNFKLIDSIYDMPFRDREFGVAFASHVLEHVGNPREAIREIKRIADHYYLLVPAWWNSAGLFWPEHKWIFPNGIEGEPVPINAPLNLILLGAVNLAVFIW